MNKTILTRPLLVGSLLVAGCSSDGDSSIVDIDKGNSQDIATMSSEAAAAVDTTMEATSLLTDITSQAMAVPDTSVGPTSLGRPASLARSTETISRTVDLDGDSVDDLQISGTMTVDTNAAMTQATMSWNYTATTLVEMTATDEDGISYSLTAGATYAASGQATYNTSDGGSSGTVSMSVTVEYSDFLVSYTDGTTSGTVAADGRLSVSGNGSFSETSSSITISATYEFTSTVTEGDTSHMIDVLGEMNGVIDAGGIEFDSQWWVAIDGTTYGPFDGDALDDLDGGATTPDA